MGSRVDNQNIQPIPGTWEIAKLENVVEILDSQRVPVNAKERALREGNIPYYGATGQVGWIDDYLFNEEIILLGEDGAPFLDPFKQKAFVVSGKSWVNNHAHVLRSLGGVLNSFVCNYLNMFDFHGYITGTTRLKLNQTRMRQIPIPLAPVSEQKRIVAEIEKQFSRLDKAVENLKQVKANLKRYKASVLKSAVEGKLTEEWRKANPCAEPADKLLERISIERRKTWEAAELAKMEAKGKAPKNDKWKNRYKDVEPPIEVDLPYIPEEWRWVRLDTVAEIKGGITKDRKRVLKSAIELPYLRVANVQRGYLDLEHIKYIQISEEKIPDFLLEEGDILFNEGGDIDKLGRGWIWEGQIERCTFQNHVFRARLYVNEIQQKWISWFSNTFGQRYFMAEGKQTTNLASINKTMLSAFPVPLPPIDEQSELIRQIEKKYSIIEKIENDLDDRFTMAENLRRSILKKAFTGKLVPQDPNDEPASVLLQKIKDEIAEIKKAPKKRKQKKKGGKVAKKIQSLVEVLKQFDEPITPETLFEASGYSIDTIDEFYEKLKEEVDLLRTIEELRPDDANVFLRLVS